SQPMRAGSAAEDRGQSLVQRVVVGAARAPVAETRIVAPFGPLDRAQEAIPELRRRGEVDRKRPGVAIDECEHQRRVRARRPARSLAGLEELGRVLAHERYGRLQERGVDLLANPGLLARIQGREDTVAGY